MGKKKIKKKNGGDFTVIPGPGLVEANDTPKEKIKTKAPTLPKAPSFEDIFPSNLGESEPISSPGFVKPKEDKPAEEPMVLLSCAHCYKKGGEVRTLIRTSLGMARELMMYHKVLAHPETIKEVELDNYGR